MTAAARLLDLLSLLQSPREWPGSELAERLEVSPRTIRRDVDRLRDLGYPIEATLGAVGGYRLVGGTAMPPLLLDDEEAVAIVVGLRTLVSHAVAGSEEASVRALAKLQQVLPPRLRSHVAALSSTTGSFDWGGPSVDPEHLTILGRAAANHERVRFEYESGAGRSSQRFCEPVGLVAVGRHWYLVAWDLDRADWRLFRVDRLRDPHAVPGRVAPRELPAPDAATFVGDQLWRMAPTIEALATVHLPAEVVLPRLPTGYGRVESIDATSCRVVLEADTIDWLAFRLTSLGGDFEVDGPPELVRHLEALGGRLQRAVRRPRAEAG